MRFQRVAIIGVGLIGGSFALALRQAKACAQLVGAGRDGANLRAALERGVVDSIAADAARAAADADLVMIAAPVAQFPAIFEAIGPRLKKTALVTDGGSTKRDVVAAARRSLGPRAAQFVPAHPIAGAEKSGAAAANADLFRGKRVVLTPLAENAPETIEAVQGAWSSCGARISRMSAEEHDAVLAAVSHLPHLLAYTLVHDIAARGNAAELFSFAAGGFRDFTRIASSHPEMWRDICVANRDRLAGEMGAFAGKLAEVRALVERGDGAALEKLFREAREARDAWLQGATPGAGPGA